MAEQLVASRIATADDRSLVERLERSAEAEARPERGGELLLEVDRPLIAARDAAAGEQAVTVVGLIDGVVVGYARCRQLATGSHRVASIDDLYVHPEARGVGVGASMLLLLRDWASEHGCTHIESQVLPGNREAKNFFERMGMVTRRMQVSTAL